MTRQRVTSAYHTRILDGVTINTSKSPTKVDGCSKCNDFMFVQVCRLSYYDGFVALSIFMVLLAITIGSNSIYCINVKIVTSCYQIVGDVFIRLN